MKQVVVLNSGGMDSAMLCKKLHDEGFDVHSLYIDYDIAAAKSQKKAAKITADKWCVEHEEIALSFGKGWDHVPMSTLLHMAIGTTYAIENGIFEVYVGAKRNQTEAFIDKYNEVYGGLKERRVVPVVSAPFVSMSEYEELATASGATQADLAHTHSCRQDTKDGTCEKCLARARFFGEE